MQLQEREHKIGELKKVQVVVERNGMNPYISDIHAKSRNFVMSSSSAINFSLYARRRTRLLLPC
jgi:hypothetical protein